MELIEVNQARCTQCGICTYVCPSRVWEMGKKVMCLWDWAFAGLDFPKCVYLGALGD
jgi:NAD-dependent dihydropyrimidine dehydrogenase PreA subunit